MLGTVSALLTAQGLRPLPSPGPSQSPLDAPTLTE